MHTKEHARECVNPDCVRRSSARDGLCRPCRPARVPVVRSRWSGVPSVPTGASTTYRAVHQRVQRGRGKAAGSPCVHCGRAAAEWAYDHADPHPLVGTTSRGRAVEYSSDAARYITLCHSCHALFDGRRV